MQLSRDNSATGFSILEVVLSLFLLLTLVGGVTMMLRAGFDVKQGLSQKNRVVKRLNNAVGRMSKDIEHAFIIPNTDTKRNGIGRRTKGVFKIEKNSRGDRLTLTTKTHQPLRSDSPESDMSYIVYELQDAKGIDGRKHLYRGESRWIPEDFRDDPPMKLFIAHVKKFELTAWRGDQWIRDGWDSGRRETRNKLPRMVKIFIEAHGIDRDEGEEADEATEEIVEQVQTVVNLIDALNYKELKAQTSTIRWEKF